MVITEERAKEIGVIENEDSDAIVCMTEEEYEAWINNELEIE